jgi:hypothetical protein
MNAMSGSSRPRVFLASTMPLADPWVCALIHGGALVYCNHVDVENSIRSFLTLTSANHAESVSTLPSQWRVQLSALAKIVRSGDAVVLTHECCWPLLDVAVALERPHGVRAMLANQGAMRRMSLIDAFKSRNVTASPRRGLARGIARVAARLAAWPFFQFYQAPGPNGPWVAWTARPWFAERLRPVDRGALASIEGPARTESVADRTRKPRLLLACGRGTHDPGPLRDVYVEAVLASITAGYEVTIKDHIRPSARINLELDERISRSDSVFFADPQVPAEVLARWSGAQLVLGVDSAVLGLAAGRCISLLPMLQMPEEARAAKRRYLEGLPGGRKIEFIESQAQMVEVLGSSDVEREA